MATTQESTEALLISGYIRSIVGQLMRVVSDRIQVVFDLAPWKLTPAAHGKQWQHIPNIDTCHMYLIIASA